MIAEYEIAPKDAATLTASREFADRFEAAARKARAPRRVANLLLSEVGGRLKALDLEQEQFARVDGWDCAGRRLARRRERSARNS
jgi:aspartyl-tRNA(Asn)/glutamyl-tRNA(Gln) amidotransferase subunit B